MNLIQSAEDRRINNDQDEHRNHEMARPIFLRRESVSDERHKDSDDMQPLLARNWLPAHDVWPDVTNREQDRQIHSDRSQSCKANEKSNQEWNLAIHRNQRFVAAISDRRKQSVGRMSNI